MTGDHGHGQQRGHTHAHGAAAARSGARHKSSLLIAFVLSLTVLVLEAVAGFLTNSLALLSDAGHMLTDVIGLGMALAAIQLADRHARSVRTTPSQHTFGLYRLEILAALVNAVLLFGVAIFVLIEAVERLRDEPEVHGWTMLVVATIGLAANLVSFWLLRKGSKESLNIEGAFLEVLSDAVGSVGVIIAALALELFGWAWIDPVVAAAIGLWILPSNLAARPASSPHPDAVGARAGRPRPPARRAGGHLRRRRRARPPRLDADVGHGRRLGTPRHGRRRRSPWRARSARGRCSLTSTGSATARSRSNPSATPAAPRSTGRTAAMASYTVNKAAVEHAKRLIDNRQYVLNSEWGDVQPNAEAQNRYLENHSWDEYACWHLGLTDGAADETKARYAFVYGDLRRLHRTGLIACVYRASEWRHKAVELAAHDLLQRLDAASG